jgi:ABC-2 type transport system ATP-binding protein
MIHISQLQKKYGQETVLDINNLTIPKGECFGLVGNNGAGKTTLFRLILDLIRPSNGLVSINGRNVHETDEWKQYTGSYLDEHFLLGFLTPDEYFKFLTSVYKLSAEDLKSHLERFEELFNGEITGKKKYIRDLSKGNIKKVGIATALLAKPDIILLDEPFENLDPSSQIRLKKLIKEEIESRNVTFLISSHDLNHVTEICDRIVILEKGSIVKDISGNEKSLSAVEAYFKA